MKGRILITGANGFIGYHLCKAMSEAGYLLDAGVRKGSDTKLLDTLDTGKIRYVFPDYGSIDNLANLLEENKYDYVIHTAGATKAPDWNIYKKINVDYSVNLAQAAMKSKINLTRFIFISSLAALGPAAYDQIEPIDENKHPQPVTSYGRSKMVAEQQLTSIPELPLTIIRPTAVYGPAEKDLLVLFQMFNKGLEAYIGSKPQTLSFVYVNDLITAIMASLKPDPIKIRSYNISDGKAYHRNELAETFKKLTGRKTMKLHIPELLIKIIASGLEGLTALTGKSSVLNREKISELTAQNWNCNIEAAVSDLAYHPQYDLYAGMEETIQWYKQHKWIQ